MTEKSKLNSSQEIPLFAGKVRPESSMSVAFSHNKAIEDEDAEMTIGRKLTDIQSRPIEDLESLLFYCSKEFYLTFQTWQLSLHPFLTMHPLASLYLSETGQIKNTIEERIKDMIKTDTHLVHKYKWVLKVVEMTGKLMVKWGLFGEKMTEQREGCEGSLLGECQRLHDLILIPDVLYLAASHSQPDSKLTKTKELQLAALLSQHFLSLLHFLMTLNSKVDFHQYGSITHYLYAGVNTNGSGELMRVVPHSHHPTYRIPSTVKNIHAQRIGFHLFDRGSVLARCCGRKPVHLRNRKLAGMMQEVMEEYVEFERLLARHSI